MIRFHIARLEKEPEELSGTEPAELLEMEPSDLLKVEAPVSYKLRAELIRGGVLVTGSAGTEISGICGRCLEPVRSTVETEPLELCFEVVPGQETLDVTEDIRSELLLAFPMNLLCSEECRGLCPVCGCNRNREKCSCKEPADSAGRWDALDQLKL